MADIPPLALERLAKLRRLHDMARAAADGLHPAVDAVRRQVEHATFSLQMATRDHHRPVVVGDDGLAYASVIRERMGHDRRGAQYVLENTVELRREPRFDADTRAVFEARARLREVVDQRREVLERATGVRRGVEAVEAALRARGWREHAVDQVRDPHGGPTVVNAATRGAR